MTRLEDLQPTAAVRGILPEQAVGVVSVQWFGSEALEAETGLTFGLGPTFVFPTATSKFAGQGAWQAGPACAAVYTGVPRLLIGFLLQNPISFAYTSANRRSQNNLAFQPVALFNLWDGWYLRSADATWIYGWRPHSPFLLPLSLGVGRVMVHPGLPSLNFYVAGEWRLVIRTRQLAPVGVLTLG